MFDDFASPPKGKGKEKDVGKRRAYVRVVTSLGGGSLNLELYCEKVRSGRMFCSRLTDGRVRHRKHATTFSSWRKRANITIVSSTAWYRDSWFVRDLIVLNTPG